MLQISSPLCLFLCAVISLVVASPARAVRHIEYGTALERSTSNHFGPLIDRDLPIGTCNPQTPCPNGACCGTNGLCGYSPLECGSGCLSNCDAKAQCGQYGASGQQTCPLNVCCSQFGFCGSTSDFCDKGCQSGFGSCGPPNRPSCGGGTSVSKRSIGYYESWSNTRQCQSVTPEALNLNGFTHINFAFAFFDPLTFAIAPMDANGASLYSRFTALKQQNSDLQTWISVGGWSFTDPGPTRTAFSDMASNSGNRQKFISGLISFMKSYGFDGVDLDWEYPAADDRGGVEADRENYVTLVKEMRAAFGSTYGISMTLPTSYWYLQHFDLQGIQTSVDWFNLMAYDLHGVWDAQSKYLGPYIAPHTNITEIDLGLDLLWRAGVTPDKVVMGEAWYGRSFTLASPTCNTPNGVCQFTGGANPGPCSNAAGILDDQEIQDIIKANKLTPVWDKTAAVKWISWGDQWVSYDDTDTFQQKRNFANSRCLGGLMVWAMDQANQTASNGVGPVAGLTTSQQQDAQQMSQDQRARVTCYTADCNAKCKSGTNKVSQMNGQPGQLSTSDRCKKGQYRNLCCDDGTIMGICQWRGYRGVGLSCISGCAEGETEVTTNTNNHGKKGDQSCTGGLQSYCCRGFKPPPTAAQIKQAAEDAAKAAAEAAAANAVLDLAAKAFCRVAVPALLLPLELVEDVIPIIGEIADAVEIAATPALIKLCVKEVEKEGKAEFKIFGKKHTLDPKKPTEKPTSRPPESTHTPAKTSSDCDDGAVEKRAIQGRAKAPACKKKPTKTLSRTAESVSEYATQVKNCAGDDKLQACLHYRSVIRNNPDFDHNTCPQSKPANTPRVAVDLYNGEHNRAWVNLINQDCQRDEWPPAAFWLSRGPGQFIRLNPASQNGKAGQIWQQLCPKRAASSKEQIASAFIEGKDVDTSIRTFRATFTMNVMKMEFEGLADPADDGLIDNPCYPRKEQLPPGAVEDPGFALLVNDPWYDTRPAARAYAIAHYPSPPFPNQKRSTWYDPEEIVVVSQNMSRKATDEELLDDFGFLRCSDEACSQEMEKLQIESLAVVGPPRSTPVPVLAIATGAAATKAMLTATVIQHTLSASFARRTAFAA